MRANQGQKAMARAAALRRANTYLRFAAALSVALLLHVFINMSWAWIWAGLYILALLFDLWVNQPVVADPAAPLSTWRRAAIVVTPFFASAIFGSLALPLFASSERFAPTLGGMLLAGALLNVVVVNGGWRPATLWSAAPHGLYLMAAPLIARAANPQAPLANILWLGSLLLIVSVIVASRSLADALKTAASAREEAETRRREAEEAVAAKSAFVAMISHELRTPISAILAGAARLHSEVQEPSSKAHAQLIGEAGDMMRVLLNDLLDFSRLEAGRMTVETAPFNLRQTLSDTLRLWRLEAAKKGLRLRVEGVAKLPRWAAGDGLRLRQVLNNLLSNAVKFTERGAVTVRLSCASDSAAHALTIKVIDTGPGISPALLPRLFTPFDQLDASVVRQHGGSGLGLAISREIARLMGGDLRVESAPGRGAIFVLILRLEPAQAPTAERPGPTIAGARVLVVDDHVVNRRAIELVLQTFGVQPTLVQSGEEALEVLRAEIFDAVLMDVYMPGMDGRDATRALRAGAGPNRDAPVVAVTASATPKDWEACLAAGMDAQVAKPIDPLQLYAALVQVLDRAGWRGGDRTSVEAV